MILTGIILGVMFRSLASFMQRLIDPNEFAIVQGSTFARFGAIQTDLLGLTALLAGAAILSAWALRHRLDVLALGRDHAISLGVHHRRDVLVVLALVAALVSVSTALVGPVTFFGFLVAALAHLVVRTHRHALLMPAAALIAGLVLVGGQTIVGPVLGQATTLSVVVESAGGLAFLAVVLRQPRR